MARRHTAAKILEIEHGDACARILNRLLIKEMLAHLMAETGGQFGHPAVAIMLVNACPSCLPGWRFPHHSMQLSTRKVTVTPSTAMRPARDVIVGSDMAGLLDPFRGCSHARGITRLGVGSRLERDKSEGGNDTDVRNIRLVVSFYIALGGQRH